jgi:hypothetical protein
VRQSDSAAPRIAESANRLARDMQGYLNPRGYGEFGAKNRAEGWNVWLTFAISPSAEASLAAKPVIRK